MAFSRREFVRRLGVGGAAVATASHIIGYGREELLAFTGEQGQRGGRPAATGADAFVSAATRTSGARARR